MKRPLAILALGLALAWTSLPWARGPGAAQPPHGGSHAPAVHAPAPRPPSGGGHAPAVHAPAFRPPSGGGHRPASPSFSAARPVARPTYHANPNPGRGFVPAVRANAYRASAARPPQHAVNQANLNRHVGNLEPYRFPPGSHLGENRPRTNQLEPYRFPPGSHLGANRPGVNRPVASGGNRLFNNRVDVNRQFTRNNVNVFRGNTFNREANYRANYGGRGIERANRFNLNERFTGNRFNANRWNAYTRDWNGRRGGNWNVARAWNPGRQWDWHGHWNRPWYGGRPWWYWNRPWSWAHWGWYHGYWNWAWSIPSVWLGGTTLGSWLGWTGDTFVYNNPYYVVPASTTVVVPAFDYSVPIPARPRPKPISSTRRFLMTRPSPIRRQPTSLPTTVLRCRR
jgi:hypothetical protein